MKCQECANTATHHVTEIVGGQPVEYHLCETHVLNLDTSKLVPQSNNPAAGFHSFWKDRELRAPMRSPESRGKVAAYLLPALCLALLDQQPEVRIISAFRLMLLGPDARSATGALRNALQDPDARVRKAAAIALAQIETDLDPPWFF